MHTDSVFSTAEMQLVTFALGEESFGIDIMNVQEIIRIPELVRVPQSLPYVRGVSNLRGSILPVIDTRAKFGMASQNIDSSSRVIVVNVNGKAAGLNVDSVSEIIRVDSRSIEAAPASLGSGLDSTSITGVVKCEGARKLVMILNTASLCNIQEGATVLNQGGSRTDTAQNQSVRDEIQIVSFLVGEEEYGLDLGAVREIIRFPAIAKVPNAPDYIKGIISLRNSLMPIIDLRTKLGAGSDQVDTGTRVIIVDLNGINVGVTVDRVFEVIRLPRETVFPPPQVFDNQAGERITGIARLDNGKRIIMLLDLQDVINSSMIQNLKNDASYLTPENEEVVLDNNADSDEQMVVFRLAGEQYGVRISQIQEITKLAKITRVPRAPEYVEGVFNLRGDLIPVIDLRRRFVMPSGERTDRSRIMVAELNQNKAGIIVDEVLEVLQIPSGCLEEMPGIVNESQDTAYINGIVKMGERLIMGLDLNSILAEEQWQQLKKMTRQPAAAKTPAKPKKK
ncbi:MAG: chemotaxis protein CheW [Syntrophomonadaceae bacterium]